MIGTTEIMVISGAAVLLFGASALPKFAPQYRPGQKRAQGGIGRCKGNRREGFRREQRVAFSVNLSESKDPGTAVRKYLDRGLFYWKLDISSLLSDLASLRRFRRGWPWQY